MLAMGLSEIMTYSFISPKYYNKVLMPENHPLRNSVVISNPLGEDSSIMRTTALPSMMEILSKNYSNRNAAAHLFELAKEYIPTTPDKLPLEKNTLIAGLYGDCDFFSVKGILEALLVKLGVSNYDIQSADNRFGYHPGRCAILTVNGQELGIIGEIHPECVKNYGIGVRVYAFSLDVDVLYAHADQEKHYTPLPKYPAVTRDLAVICDEDIPVLTLEKAITAAAGKYLDSLSLFDVYQGKQIDEGKKSVAFNIVLRSADSTLTDEQANASMDKIIKALEKAGAVLRS